MGQKKERGRGSGAERRGVKVRAQPDDVHKHGYFGTNVTVLGCVSDGLTD